MDGQKNGVATKGRFQTNTYSQILKVRVSPQAVSLTVSLDRHAQTVTRFLDIHAFATNIEPHPIIRVPPSFLGKSNDTLCLKLSIILEANIA